MNEQFLLKNYIDDDAIHELANSIHAVWNEFPREVFAEKCKQDLGQLEFTKRTNHIAQQLLVYLPPSIPKALEILTECLPPATETHDLIPRYSWVWPIADFIRDYSDEFWEETMAAINKLCQCGKAEYAIRPMLKLFPQKTMQRLVEWCDSPSEKIRLFCSEACRIRIPWASRIELPRHLVFPILNALKYDSSPIVQNSVANHLADLGKTEEHWLLRHMRDWCSTGNENAKTIAKKALQGLAKEGNDQALHIMGLDPLDLERVSFFVNPQQVSVGDEVTAKLEITGDLEGQKRLLVNWIIYYAREGRTPYRKVFHGKEVELEEEANAFVCEKTFRMSPYSTKRLFPGIHRIEVQINGQTIAGLDFKLIERRMENVDMVFENPNQSLIANVDAWTTNDMDSMDSIESFPERSPVKRS